MEARTLLDSIDSSDQLLLAGLARLLGASRLMFVGEYEEASLSLFVAMGAAREFIRQHLEQNGGCPASFAQVYKYLRATFPHGEDVADFFEGMYELRLTATHPANRFGEFWAPPIMACDLFELRKSVAALYRYVVLGEVPFQGEAR